MVQIEIKELVEEYPFTAEAQRKLRPRRERKRAEEREESGGERRRAEESPPSSYLHLFSRQGLSFLCASAVNGYFFYLFSPRGLSFLCASAVNGTLQFEPP